MVQLIAWILLLATTAQAATSTRPLSLQWQGDKGPGCQKLLEVFLSELRSMAADRVIELDLLVTAGTSGGDNPARRLPVRCMPSESRLVVGDGPDALQMRYLAKASGFDASDWLIFQQRNLRPESDAIHLAPETSPEPASAKPAPELISTSPSPQAPGPIAPESVANASEPKAFYKNWWFWAAIAAAGGGIFAATQVLAADRNSGISVEIH